MLHRLGVAAFLIAHGVVHVFVWVMKPSEDVKQAFDASNSWILGPARGLAAPVAAAAMCVLILAGVTLLFHADVWRSVAVVGLAMSLFLSVAFFNPWFVSITVANAAMIYVVVARHWPATATVGA